jgi:PAS domain S-box-containing protein
VDANDAACTLTGYSRDELRELTVLELTPTAQTEAAQLWDEFRESGVQHGRYDLRRKDCALVRVRYWAFANVAPGLHLSLLMR